MDAATVAEIDRAKIPVDTIAFGPWSDYALLYKIAPATSEDFAAAKQSPAASILDNKSLPDDPLHRRHGSVKTWGQRIIEDGYANGAHPHPDSPAPGADAPPGKTEPAAAAAGDGAGNAAGDAPMETAPPAVEPPAAPT